MFKVFHIAINSHRLYGLDILRALAILFVLLGHGALLLPEELKALHRWFVFDGVSIFFVLSGYLIGGILIRDFSQSRPDLRVLIHFWLRRWFRTLPNYFLILSVLVLLHLSLYPNVNLGEFKAYFFFLQNFNWPHPPYFPEAWSLSVEEWFYLISPLLLLGLLKVFKLPLKESLLILALGLILFSLGFRLERYSDMGEITKTQWAALFRKQVLSRFDSLMFGMLAAWVHHYFPRFWHGQPRKYFLLGIALFIGSKLAYQLGLLAVDGLYHAGFSFTVTALATALLLPFLSQLKSGQGALYRALSRISLISYSLYLTNLSLVQGFILDKIDWQNLGAGDFGRYYLPYILFWLLSAGLSILLYKYFEIPTTAWRKAAWIKRLGQKKSP